MSDGAKLTRQQLYQRIRETSKDEYILSEMKRLGFWPDNSAKPSLAESVLKEQTELAQKLRDLGQKQGLYSDPEAALKALHKQRKEEALRRREEKKQERNQARYDRAKRWHNTQQKIITYVGNDFSKGLNDVQSDESKLKQQNLPVAHDSKDLATIMGITLNELRFLTYQKDVSAISHYQRFEILKKTGGSRLISAPMPRLKRAQYWILEKILQPLSLHDAAHGFVAKRSILSNAQPHVGKNVVINLDLKDFFPTVTYPRVKGVFKNLGYSEHLATVLGLLCTQSDTQEVELDEQTWFVSNGERFLPQGAPTSPNITNVLCRKLDIRLKGMANNLGFIYTRYADDLTFSSNTKDDHEIRQLLWRCRKIVRDEGFIVHPQKTRIMRKHKKQEVTGVTVNDKPGVDKKTLKRFRAVLFQIDKDGAEGKTWGKGNIFCAIDGYANYVTMIDPAKGILLQKQVVHIKRKYDIDVKKGKVLSLNKKLLRIKAAAGESPKDDWWQASPPPSPIKELTTEEIKLVKTEEKKQKRQDSNRSEQNWTTPGGDQTKSDQGTASPGYTMLMICIFIIIIWFFIR